MSIHNFIENYKISQRDKQIIIETKKIKLLHFIKIQFDLTSFVFI